MVNPNQAPEDLWKRLNSAGETRQYERGAILYRAGAHAEGIYLIQHGQVRLQLGGNRKKHILESSGPGTILALADAMCGDCHKLTAETATPAQIRFINRETLLELLRITPLACMQIVQLLSEDLLRLHDTLRNGPFRKPGRPT